MKKQLFLAVFVVVLFSGIHAQLPAQVAETPSVFISEYVFSEEKIDKAIELLSDLQLKTLENETGCIAFDVLLSEDNPENIFIYEAYENEKAYNIHIKKIYYIEILTKKIKPLIKSVKTTKVYPINIDELMFDADF